MKDIYTILRNLGIEYKEHKHPPVFTVEEAERHSTDIPGGRSKNLFLRNKKSSKYFLVIADTATKIDFEIVAALIGESSVGLASAERLERVLGVKSGAVSPFSIINDDIKQVRVLVDNQLFQFKELGFHPNVNTETLIINASDFRKFLELSGNLIQFVDF
jgi:Ala-tRNA(Pro) deacylase